MVTHTSTLYINSGICKCGCSWEDHHLMFIVRKEVLNQLPPGYPPYVPGECESYGFNEMGGKQLQDGEWVDHCHQYEDKDGPLGYIAWED